MALAASLSQQTAAPIMSSQLSGNRIHDEERVWSHQPDVVGAAALKRTVPEWLSYWQAQHPAGIALGLERVRAVAERLGIERPGAHVITVAGTNGKGSTVAFLEAIARAAGKRVGAYTSPHVLRYNERIRVDGQAVADADLLAAFVAVDEARAGEALTFFEATTLAALWIFQQAELDIAVLEVGLGGRLDAVNIIDADCAIITTVDLDHQDWLGSDIEAIGFEKAGIARPWKPLVLGDDDPPASVLRHAYAVGASTWRISNDFFVERLDEAHWRWREVGFEVVLPVPALLAPVQLRNAACAIAALRSLDLEIAPEALAAGVANAQILARLQRLPDEQVELWLDVGHNRQAAQSLADALRQMPKKRTIAVYAALADKDAKAVSEALREEVDGWVVAASLAAGERGQTADALQARLAEDLPIIGQAPCMAKGIALAREAAGNDGRVLIFGSFHAAEEALKCHFPVLVA